MQAKSDEKVFKITDACRGEVTEVAEQARSIVNQDMDGMSALLQAAEAHLSAAIPDADSGTATLLRKDIELLKRCVDTHRSLILALFPQPAEIKGEENSAVKEEPKEQAPTSQGDK